MKKSTKYLAITALVLSIVINYGCPGFFGYNVVGTWSFTATYDVGGTENWTITFAGDKKTGAVTLTSNGDSITGTYMVNGKDIDFDVSASDGIITFAGTFDNNKEMSGFGTVLLYADASSVLSNMMRRQARAAALSESFAFDWIGIKI
jgi:hypothetical protein